MELSITKRILEENEARGFSADDSITVCTNCFDDIGIKKFIETAASNNDNCDFCADLGGLTCNFEAAMEHIIGSIHREWSHPEQDGMSYNTKEGGWLGGVIDTWELFAEIGFEANHPDLTDLIYESVNDDQWCRRNHRSQSDDEILISGWITFVDFVLHKARYTFFKTIPQNYDMNQHDEMNPVAILNSLADMVERLNLMTLLKSDQKIFRVRIVDIDRNLNSAEELGSPPTENCTLANRMSPAGISMFYGSFEVETAIKETYIPDKTKKKKAVCGIFQPIRDLTLLDLTKIPKVPSLFNAEFHEVRHAIIFLNDFLQDFTKSISRDDRAHIEYVPTQIVSEFFRNCFIKKNGEHVDGIVYPSSKNVAHSSIVIFANNDQCRKEQTIWRNTNSQILQLVKVNDIEL